MRTCSKGVSGGFTLPDNCTVLAETTSTYAVVRDRTALTGILFVRIGTSIMSASWERIDSKFLLKIRAVKNIIGNERTAVITRALQIR
jgi:hypothetical protein